MNLLPTHLSHQEQLAESEEICLFWQEGHFSREAENPSSSDDRCGHQRSSVMLSGCSNKLTFPFRSKFINELTHTALLQDKTKYVTVIFHKE